MSAERYTKSGSQATPADTGRVILQRLVEKKPETFVTGRLTYESAVVGQCLPKWGSSLEALADVVDALDEQDPNHVQSHLVDAANLITNAFTQR